MLGVSEVGDGSTTPGVFHGIRLSIYTELNWHNARLNRILYMRHYKSHSPESNKRLSLTIEYSPAKSVLGLAGYTVLGQYGAQLYGTNRHVCVQQV